MRRKFAFNSTFKVLGLLLLCGIMWGPRTSQANVYTSLSGPGVRSDDTLYTDHPVTFNIHLRNDSSKYIPCFELSFRLYSDEGATWSIPVHRFADSLDKYFDLGLFKFESSVTGDGADTITIVAMAEDSSGLPPGCDDIIFSITTTICGPGAGTTIGFDSCSIPPGYNWLFCLDDGGTISDFPPPWDGPHDFIARTPPSGPPWLYGDPHVMHFPMLPDTLCCDAYDVIATYPSVMADDWRCEKSGWMKDIHFWGGWTDRTQNSVVNLILSLHEDIPASPPEIPFGKPGNKLWEKAIRIYGEWDIYGPHEPQWYDPVYESPPKGFDWSVRRTQYDIYLDSLDWYWLDSGVVYWLSLSAEIEDTIYYERWCWRSADWLCPWGDNAVWMRLGESEWDELWKPQPGDDPLHLSFVITSNDSLLHIDSCGYYKSPYVDYAPYGVPDFDQKQDNWKNSSTGKWSYCGPVALANCVWWLGAATRA